MQENEEKEEILKEDTENILNNENIDESPIEEFVDVDADGEELMGASVGVNTIKKLREKVKTLEYEKAEYMLNWQRALADYKNREKQITEEKKEWGAYAVKRYTEDLLIVMDTYDAAKSNKEAWEMVDTNWRSGIEYIFNTFENKLAEQGFEKFGAVGEEYSPELHEALGVLEAKTDEDKIKNQNKIAQIIMSGYMYKAVLFRAAKVKVWG